MQKNNPDYFRKLQGKKGEDIAAEDLKSKGYRIIERNFQKGYGEIDIIALDGKTLVFVEVKTRTSLRYGTPSESITRFKLKALIRSVKYYKLIHPEMPDLMRIDFVGVLLYGSHKPYITHIKNITQ